MYNYCQEGWPVGIDNLGSSMIVVYPNPSLGIFRVDTRLDVIIEVYDMNGRVITQSTLKQIDLSDQPSGVYNMSIMYNELRINKRIVKQ